MNIMDFSLKVKEGIMEYLGDNYEVEYKEVLKNNNVPYHALIVREKGDLVAPTIYVDRMYEDYLEGKDVFGELGDLVDAVISSRARAGFDLDFLNDFSDVTHKLSFKIVNYDKNKETLKDIPYKRVCDLALVPMCIIDDPGVGRGGITISNTFLEKWEVSAGELWENVIENSPQVRPIQVDKLMDVMRGMVGDDSFAGEEAESEQTTYIITNREKFQGAGAVFYPGVLSDMAEKLEGNIYVIPSSIHEVLIVPADNEIVDPKALKDIIHEVNDTTVEDEDLLSDNLYIYDAEKESLEIYA